MSSAPLNGYELTGAYPVFDHAGEVRHWVVVVDRSTSSVPLVPTTSKSDPNRFAIAHTIDLTSPVWSWTYDYAPTAVEAVEIAARKAGRSPR